MGSGIPQGALTDARYPYTLISILIPDTRYLTPET